MWMQLFVVLVLAVHLVGQHSIEIDGSFDDWNFVPVSVNDTEGDVTVTSACTEASYRFFDHFFDILNLFVGSEPRWVFATALLTDQQKLFQSC